MAYEFVKSAKSASISANNSKILFFKVTFSFFTFQPLLCSRQISDLLACRQTDQSRGLPENKAKKMVIRFNSKYLLSCVTREKGISLCNEHPQMLINIYDRNRTYKYK